MGLGPHGPPAPPCQPHVPPALSCQPRALHAMGCPPSPALASPSRVSMVLIITVFLVCISEPRCSGLVSAGRGGQLGHGQGGARSCCGRAAPLALARPRPTAMGSSHAAHGWPPSPPHGGLGSGLDSGTPPGKEGGWPSPCPLAPPDPPRKLIAEAKLWMGRLILRHTEKGQSVTRPCHASPPCRPHQPPRRPHRPRAAPTPPAPPHNAAHARPCLPTMPSPTPGAVLPAWPCPARL